MSKSGRRGTPVNGLGTAERTQQGIASTGKAFRAFLTKQEEQLKVKRSPDDKTMNAANVI